jgi:hypothetical protein
VKIRTSESLSIYQTTYLAQLHPQDAVGAGGVPAAGVVGVEGGAAFGLRSAPLSAVRVADVGGAPARRVPRKSI